jgi:hypothetical protein
MKRAFALRLGGFGRAALSQQAARQRVSLDRLLGEAVLYYTADLPSGRPAARLPELLRGDKRAERARWRVTDVALELDQTTWRVLEEESRGRQLPLERLIEYAAFYYLADIESGRLALRLIGGDD